MSKAISMDLIMTSASTRSDGSLGMRFASGELEPSEKTTLFELLNKNLKVIIQPKDEPAESLVEVKSTLGFKTPGQRLRAVLFLEWKQKNNDVLFEEHYQKRMDQIIERCKANLDPQ